MRENEGLLKRAHIRSIPNSNFSVPIICIAVCTFLLLLVLISSSSYPPSFLSRIPSSDLNDPVKIESLPELPRFAYLITGTKGDGVRLKRLLQAVYHPRNYYLLHLDFEASDAERLELAKYAKSDEVLRQFRNVMVMGKPNLLTSKGPTMLASTLHAVAILLKQAKRWDWFINLSASDYPLMPQDDILHIFSFLPRDLNFLEHTSNLGWKEVQRARPIIIDPGLYHSKKSNVFWAKEKRSLPVAFKLFVGSAWVVLSRPFLEFCIWGWDNIPRILLLYYTNFLSSPEGYFQTVVCNHKDFQNATVNYDLHYMQYDDPSKQHLVNLTVKHFDDMLLSGAPFAHKFASDDDILNKIDTEILKRYDGHFTPGGWCMGAYYGPGKDPCAVTGNPESVKPSSSSKRKIGKIKSKNQITGETQKKKKKANHCSRIIIIIIALIVAEEEEEKKIITHKN